MKLKDDFFRQKEIKQLRRIAGGDSYTIIYLKMLLRSLKDDGKLYYEGVDTDFVSELALDIDEDVENVKMTVAFLTAKGLLVQSDPDEYALLMAGEMTGSEGYSAERMRRLREKKLIASHCDTSVTLGDEERREKREETEIEIESREKKRKRFVKPTVDEIKAYADEIGYNLDPQAFIDHYEANGWKVGGKSPMQDWKAVIRNWRRRESNSSARGKVQTPTSAPTVYTDPDYENYW